MLERLENLLVLALCWAWGRWEALRAKRWARSQTRARKNWIQ
jgi:hypothetical protein